MTENEVYALIPVTAIAMGLGSAMLKIWLDYRRKYHFFQMHHAERMAAIDKGIELPALPPEFFADYQRRSRTEYLRFGLVWSLVGIAISFALFLTSRELWGWGAVPFAVGIANLLFYWTRKESST